MGVLDGAPLAGAVAAAPAGGVALGVPAGRGVGVKFTAGAAEVDGGVAWTGFVGVSEPLIGAPAGGVGSAGRVALELRESSSCKLLPR